MNHLLYMYICIKWFILYIFNIKNILWTTDCLLKINNIHKNNIRLYFFNICEKENKFYINL